MAVKRAGWTQEQFTSTRVRQCSAAMCWCCGRGSKNAAIDDKLCSLDVSCLIRRKKEDGVGYIFGSTDAIEWNHGLEATLACRSGFGRHGRSLPDRRFDNARNNSVDSDATR
jgi:hypothetical protein